MYFRKTLIAALVSAAAGTAGAVPALTGTTALTETGSNATTSEATQPFLLAKGWKQEFVTDVAYMDSYFGPGNYPSTFRNWDMIDFGGADNEFIYIPHEVGQGAGLTRYNRNTGDAAILLQGDNTGNFSTNPATWSPTNDDFGALDPAVVTPSGSLVTAEEWSGSGRIFELSNPTTATGTGDAAWNWLSNIPSVSHEGIKFDASGNMYFVDENNTGSVYKFAPKAAGDLTAGQTFVLVDSDYAGDPTKDWDDVSQAGQDRTGAATWVAITDADGNATTVADPFDFSTRGGRAAADEVNGTPFGRPEDLEIGVLANGNEVLYMATTSENIVWSFELDPNGIDILTREYVATGMTSDVTTGLPVVEGANDADYGLDDPDNLAIDAMGNVYVIEDENPGDIWQAVDTDMDGIADVIGLLASLGPFGSEPTGFIADPNDPNAFYVAIQHPNSGNDALWRISFVGNVPTPAAALLMLAGLPMLRRRNRK